MEGDWLCGVTDRGAWNRLAGTADAPVIPIAFIGQGNTGTKIPAPSKFTATPTSRVTSGKTSALIKGGDVPPVGEYTITKIIAKMLISGVRAGLPSGILKQKAKTGISQAGLGGPGGNMIERPYFSEGQYAGRPKM